MKLRNPKQPRRRRMTTPTQTWRLHRLPQLHRRPRRVRDLGLLHHLHHRVRDLDLPHHQVLQDLRLRDSFHPQHLQQAKIIKIDYEGSERRAEKATMAHTIRDAQGKHQRPCRRRLPLAARIAENDEQLMTPRRSRPTSTGAWTTSRILFRRTKDSRFKGT